MNKPNIIFILSDDQGAWALASGGNKEIITPNLDRLAENGVRYENFFCSSPVCSPARASIVTGEMPSCHGVIDWLGAGNVDTEKYPVLQQNYPNKPCDTAIEFLEGHTTYIQRLQENGYRCAHTGKWHLGASDQPKAGYEKWTALEGGGTPYYQSCMVENGVFTCHKDYVTDVITNKGVEYLNELLDENVQQPFYLSVHYTAPHSPWGAEQHPKKYLDMYEDCPFVSTPDSPIHPNQINSCKAGGTPLARRENLTGYYASITAMDANIGRILDMVDDSKKADNTIIIFTSDNGMNMGHHGIWGKGNGTYPQNMFDSSVKVPFIITTPDTKEKGRVHQSLHSQCDIFPTIMEIAGIQSAPNSRQIGTSFYGEVADESMSLPTQQVAICCEYGSVRMLRTKDKKLVLRYGIGESEFYHLECDKDETHNLINDVACHSEIDEMRKELERLFVITSDPNYDGRQFEVSGKGQMDRCVKPNAFRQGYRFYYEK